MAKIAWIGTGVMGGSMAANLAKCGHEVTLFNKTYEKAKRVADDNGLVAKQSIKEAIDGAAYIFVIVGYPKDVEEVFQSEGGILNNAAPGTYVIDMTTSAPALAEQNYQLGKDKGIHVLDAPVSGGDSGAKNGTLSIMVGADQADFDKVKPLFECMGKNIVHCGKPGAGQHTKAANQIAVAGATAAYTEALIYAESVGLDPQVMLAAIGAGAAGSWQLNNMAPRVLKGDLAPGFFVKHFIKDMRIVDGEVRTRNVELPMLTVVLNMYEKMADQGLGDDGTQALIKIYK